MRDLLPIPVRVGSGVYGHWGLTEVTFDCSDEFEPGLERLVRFFERERVAPAPPARHPPPGSVGSAPASVTVDRLPRRILREVASRCLDGRSFRELLGPTLLDPETLGTTLRDQLVVLLHEDARHGGPRKLFLELFQDKYGGLLQSGTGSAERA